MPLTDYTADFDARGAGGAMVYGLEKSYNEPGTKKIGVFFETENLGSDRPLVDNPNINPSNFETKPYSLFVDTSKASFRYVPDVMTLLRLRLSQRGHYIYASPDAAVGDWTVRSLVPGVDTPVADYLRSLWFDMYRSDLLGHRLTGARISEMVMNVVENQFVKCDHNLMYAVDTHLGDAVAEVGTPGVGAFVGTVNIYGHRNDPESADVIKMIVLAAGALDGTATVQFTRGATAYAGAGFPVYDGKKLEVIYGDGERAGTYEEGEPVYVVIKAVSGTLSIGDEYTFVAKRGTPTGGVYSTSQPLNGVSAEASIIRGAVEKTYALHSLELRYATPMKINTGLGTKYNYGVIANDVERCLWTLQRDYTDLDFYQDVVNGAVASINMDIAGSRIGATTYFENCNFFTAKARIATPGVRIGSRNALPESVTLKGFSTTPTEQTLVETYRLPLLLADL